MCNRKIWRDTLNPKLAPQLEDEAPDLLSAGESIKRSDKAKGFHVLSRRWAVERTFAWLGRCRRLAKDWGNDRRVINRMGDHRLHPYAYPAN